MVGLVAQDGDAGAGSQQVGGIHGTADSERGDGPFVLGRTGRRSILGGRRQECHRSLRWRGSGAGVLG